jgi:hypothetical protein
MSDVKLGVKAVSLISSFAAIGDCMKPATEQDGKVYTEADWLPQSEQDCEKTDTKSKYVIVIIHMILID